jgi:uncharacterized protein GlcG (DUF336 family)
VSKYIERPVISHETALKILTIAVKEGEKLGVSVSATVVDSMMNLVAFVRTDNATAHSAETSRRKANAAASTNRATGWMTGGLEVSLPAASGNKLTNIPGGVPVQFDDKHVGGLGIAGGTVDQDEAIAKATLRIVCKDTDKKHAQ